MNADRQQHAKLALRDVAYVIEARFERTARWGADDTDGKHLDMFNRRTPRHGQCFHRPCLGVREFAADFELVEEGWPADTLDERDRNLGWMLHDIDFDAGKVSRFFRAPMEDGAIDVERQLAEGATG